jgi:uncharacterized membrane protein
LRVYVGVTSAVYLMLAYQIIRAAILFEHPYNDDAYTVIDWCILSVLYMFAVSLCALYVFYYVSLRSLIKQIERLASQEVNLKDSVAVVDMKKSMASSKKSMASS